MTVLTLVVVVTVLVGTVLAVQVGQTRFVRRDVHRTQAQYAAEGCIYQALGWLEERFDWTELPGTFSAGTHACTLTAKPHGGFLHVTATVQVGQRTVALRATVGETPADAFQQAVVLGDHARTLHVAGHTRLRGGLWLGQDGYRESRLGRRGFTGKVEGTLEMFGPSPLLELHQDVFRATLDTFDRYLHRPPNHSARLHARQDLTLGPQDSIALGKTSLLLVEGTLTLQGPLHLPPGLRVVTTDTLTILGAVQGQDLLAYSPVGVVFSGATQLDGQFLTRGDIVIQTGTRLRYPTVLYLAESGEGRLVLQAQTEVHGTLIQARPVAGFTGEEATQILVAPQAHLRGSLYSRGRTELRGKVTGSVLTQQFYFYESPTHYVNWLYDAEVDVWRRPASYVLPLRFSEQPRLQVLRWEHLPMPLSVLDLPT